jgi:hypothetical protein
MPRVIRPAGALWNAGWPPKPFPAGAAAEAAGNAASPKPLPKPGAPKGFALAPAAVARPLTPTPAGDCAKMLAGALEDAADEPWPSVELPKVEGPNGSAGDGPEGMKTVASERLHREHLQLLTPQ